MYKDNGFVLGIEKMMKEYLASFKIQEEDNKVKVTSRGNIYFFWQDKEIPNRIKFYFQCNNEKPYYTNYFPVYVNYIKNSMQDI